MSTSTRNTDPRRHSTATNTAAVTVACSAAATDNSSDTTTKRDDETAKITTATMTRDQPGYWDVTLGRGRCFQEHPGNIRMHAIVGEYKARYSRGNNHEKRQIVLRVMKEIKARPTPRAPWCINKDASYHGGQSLRFLKRRVASKEQDCQEIWEVVSDAMAFKKVQHALRGKGQGSKYTLSSLPKSKGARVHEEIIRDSTQPHPTVYSTGTSPRPYASGREEQEERSWLQRCSPYHRHHGEGQALKTHDASAKVPPSNLTDALGYEQNPRSFETSKTTLIRGSSPEQPIGATMLPCQDATYYANGVGYHPSCSASPSEVSLDDSLEPLPVHAADTDPFNGHDVLCHFSSELLLMANKKPDEETPASTSDKDETEPSSKHKKTACPPATHFEGRDGLADQYHHYNGAGKNYYFHQQSRSFLPILGPAYHGASGDFNKSNASDLGAMKPRGCANSFLPPRSNLRVQEPSSQGRWINGRNFEQEGNHSYWHQYDHQSWAKLAPCGQSVADPFGYHTKQAHTSGGQYSSRKSQAYFSSHPTTTANNIANDWSDRLEELDLELDLDLENDLDQDDYLSLDPVPLHAI